MTDADFPSHPQAEIDLGRLLFWDPVLSGNRNISCATCHHPRLGTSDGLSLGIGEGGGASARPEAGSGRLSEQRIPRNAPGLWNVGARGFTVLFADGRSRSILVGQPVSGHPGRRDGVGLRVASVRADDVSGAFERRDGRAL
ncbi:MAG: cytochrome-c peroxidase [Paracoccaceae bacterium]